MHVDFQTIPQTLKQYRFITENEKVQTRVKTVGTGTGGI